MKRLGTVITHAILPVGLILFDLTDLNILAADISIPDNEVISSVSKKSNSSASATIAITIYAVGGE